MVPIWSTPMRQPGRVAPVLEQLPALAVVIGQRLAVVAAGDARPDLGQFVDRCPRAGRR